MKIRMAQYGTKHGHASGKLLALKENPAIDLVGVFEPDTKQREQLEGKLEPYLGVTFFDSEDQILQDKSIIAVASEGQNAESLNQTARLIESGKHVWYDKPAGDDWSKWKEVISLAKKSDLQIQMGYMLRYHDGFREIATWARDGMLGDIYSIRAHMSTNISPEARAIISEGHDGGIFYDLAGHMIDQVVWILGRPLKTTSFLRNDSGVVPGFSDNTLGVFEYQNAMAWVDIAAMEIAPMARRFEVYGSEGSAILIEPFEPGKTIRLCLRKDRKNYKSGEQFYEGEHFIEIEGTQRQLAYERELQSFISVIMGECPSDRSLDHELLVQETLLRALGRIQ